MSKVTIFEFKGRLYRRVERTVATFLGSHQPREIISVYPADRTPEPEVKVEKDVTITLRFRGTLPEGVDAQAAANDLLERLHEGINFEDFIDTEFRVKDAWVTTVKDER